MARNLYTVSPQLSKWKNVCLFLSLSKFPYHPHSSLQNVPSPDQPLHSSTLQQVVHHTQAVSMQSSIRILINRPFVFDAETWEYSGKFGSSKSWRYRYHSCKPWWKNKNTSWSVKLFQLLWSLWISGLFHWNRITEWILEIFLLSFLIRYMLASMFQRNCRDSTAIVTLTSPILLIHTGSYILSPPGLYLTSESILSSDMFALT